MTEEFSNPGHQGRPRRSAIIAAGLLLAALALVVLYTTRRAFLSPVALVVVAAIGVAALLLQRRLNPNAKVAPGAKVFSRRGTLWLNLLGVVFAVGTLVADIFHLSARVMLVAALAGVVFFAASGAMVLSALRKRRV